VLKVLKVLKERKEIQDHWVLKEILELKVLQVQTIIP
jgi:hypothetical protein